MQYEANSIDFLAQVRHVELQAEAEQYRSGRQEATLAPTFSELMVAAAERFACMWAKVSPFRLRAWSTADARADGIACAASIGEPLPSLPHDLTVALTHTTARKG